MENARAVFWCFQGLASEQCYDGAFFRSHFPQQAEDHPCQVHIVGQIFVRAGIAVEDSGKYVLLAP